MSQRIFFVIGTDTGVGKTVLAALLARHLRERGVAVAAIKPLCSGGRNDARLLHSAAGKFLPLDEVNPWHFHAPLAPLLAARLENKSVSLRAVISHVRQVQKRFATVIVEGAGGLLSPLGENFNARDCLLALRATPVLVCPNQLGAINQVLLVLHALPDAAAKNLRLVFMSPRRENRVSRSNVKLLAEWIDPKRLHTLPWLRQPFNARSNHRLQKTLAGIVDTPDL